MKKYYMHTSKYSNQEIGSIREQYDVVSYLLSVMELLNVEPFNKIESHAEFDSINKTIILNCYNGHRESYYKKYKKEGFFNGK